MLECGREEMPFHVMHADYGNPSPEGKRLCEAHADEQRSDETWRVRHRNGVDVGQLDAGLGQCTIHDGNDCPEMLA